MFRGMLRTFEDMIFLEEFTNLNGLLQKIDARMKLFCFTAFILTAVSSRTITPLIILSIPVFTLAAASKIPLKFFFLRTAIFIPAFAAILALPLLFMTPGRPLATIGFSGYVIAVTWEGICRAALFTARIWVCTASLTLLVLTTKFFRLVHALEKLRIPRLFVAMTAVTYRFIFLFIDETYRMVLAKEARTVKREGRLQIMRSLAYIISTLFVRAYERGERVHLAMIARGYSGEVKSMAEAKCNRKDWIFGFLCILPCFATLLVQLYP